MTQFNLLPLFSLLFPIYFVAVVVVILDWMILFPD